MGSAAQFADCRAVQAANVTGRREDYRELRALGLSVIETARRMGVSDSTAWRYERTRKADQAASGRRASGWYGYSPVRGTARG
jgi:hypothetical protein